MALIDFKEIPAGNGSNGTQDMFELFAREFFIAMGFAILLEPNRGADGGCDLVVLEKRNGLIGDSEIKWLVSCKHKAHSGKSVCENDEIDIPGRVEAFKCDGFIGFYSTVCSSGLANKINSFKGRFEVCIYDQEMIERILLDIHDGQKLLNRFFPISNQQFKRPANIYSKYTPIKCAACGKDLLNKKIIDDYSGIIVLAYNINYLENNTKKRYEKVYCVCKGPCDCKMEQLLGEGIATEWEDISDLSIPWFFLNWTMGIMNEVRDGKIEYTDEAYENIKTYTLSIAQLVMRNQSVNEINRIKNLQELPEGL